MFDLILIFQPAGAMGYSTKWKPVAQKSLITSSVKVSKPPVILLFLHVIDAAWSLRFCNINVESFLNRAISWSFIKNNHD